MGRNPRLTEEEAEEIRDLYVIQNTKWTVVGLARSYHVLPSTVRAVLMRRGAYARKPSKPGGAQ